MTPEQKPKSPNLATAQLILSATAPISFVIVMCVAGYLAGNKKASEILNETPIVAIETPTIVSTPEVTPIAKPTRITPCPAVDFSDWKTYKNKEYGFGLQYPCSWDFETVSTLENPEDISSVKISSDHVELILTVKNKPSDFSGLKKYLNALAAEKNSEYEDYIIRYSVQKMIIPSREIPFALVYTGTGGNSGAQAGAITSDVYFETENNFFIGSYSSDFEAQDLYEDEYCAIPLILASFSILPEPAIFGSMSAYVKEDANYNYAVLSEEGKETIINKGRMEYGDLNDDYDDWGPVRFHSPSFSPSGNYLMYWAGVHEGSLSYIYDTKNKNDILSFMAFPDEANVGFTPDEKYFYVCSWGGMGSDSLGSIYAVPSFEVVYDALSALRTAGASCRYDLETDSIIFYHEFYDDEITDTIKYSLKEQKEYMLDKEIDNE
ncbi:hypothetical protein KKD57_04265 [Patescibacteria group bacterium]|nr:hypothetical protein [Patescibacteria group bacterium]